jgi:hypothetical protein
MEHIKIRRKDVREENTKLIINFYRNWLKYRVQKFCRKNLAFSEMLIPLCQIVLKSIQQISSCFIQRDVAMLMCSSLFPMHHKYKVLKKRDNHYKLKHSLQTIISSSHFR